MSGRDDKAGRGDRSGRDDRAGKIRMIPVDILGEVGWVLEAHRRYLERKGPLRALATLIGLHQC